jgi:hypothetical protein
MSTINNDDLFLVARDSENYKVSASDLSDFVIQNLPEDNSGGETARFTTVTPNRTTNKTLVNREIVQAAVPGLTITLPSNPSPGWEVAIGVGNFINTVIGRNGENIMGLGENVTIDSPNLTLNLIYIGPPEGWRIL